MAAKKATKPKPKRPASRDNLVYPVKRCNKCKRWHQQGSAHKC